MDPLAEGHYPGEWINVEDLRRFATVKDGKVMAAATPAPPISDVGPAHRSRLPARRDSRLDRAGHRRIDLAGLKVSLSIGYGFPAPLRHSASSDSWDPVAAPRPQPGEPDAGRRRHRPRAGHRRTARARPGDHPVPAGPGRSVGLQGRSARARDPGMLPARIGLAEADKKVPSRSFKTIDGRGPPTVCREHRPAQGGRGHGRGRAAVHVAVGNIGTVDWRPPPPDSDDPPPVAPVTATLLTLVWRAADGSELRPPPPADRPRPGPGRPS